MTIDKKKVLEEAKKEAARWIDAADFSGKSDLNKIHEELRKLRYEGKAPLVFVVQNKKDATSAIKEGVLELCNGDKKKAKKALKELSPHLCIWDYYLMAFYEAAYHRLPIQDSEFMSHSLFEAFKAGLGFIINLGGLVIGITRPEAYRDENMRIHKEDGPAIIWGEERTYFWHGTKVPGEWIEDRDKKVTKEKFLSINNQEEKRCFCEIYGWENVLNALGYEKIQGDDWGDLIKADLGDDEGKPAIFADVHCPSTDRRYLIRTNPTTKTCKEALAKSAKLEADDYNFVAES